MKWIKSNDDSSIIERELDDIKSHSGQFPRGGNYGAPAGNGNFAGGDNPAGDASILGRLDAEAAKRSKQAFIMRRVLLVIITFVAVMLATLVFSNYLEKYKQYEYAEAEMKEGRYLDAAFAYRDLRDFKDSEKKFSEAKLLVLNDLLEDADYEKAMYVYLQFTGKDWENTSDNLELQNKVKFGLAVCYYNQEDYLTAIDICKKLDGMPGCAELVKACEENLGGEEYFAVRALDKRSIITFGKFEQDNNASNGPEPIEWYVAANIDNKDGVYLVLFSKNCLDCRPYQNKKPFTDWKNCSLRKWLNNDFYNKAFSKQERMKMQTVEIKPEWNKFFNDNIADLEKDNFFKAPAPVSSDKVFIFSDDELGFLRFMGDEEDGRATPYAISHGASVISGKCWYWLREQYAELNKESFTKDFIVSHPFTQNSRMRGFGNFAADSSLVTVRPAVIILAVKKKHISGSGDDKARPVPAGS